MVRDFAIPTIGAFLATLLFATAAGFGDWSAADVYAGMAGVGLIWLALLAWTDRHLHELYGEVRVPLLL